MNERFSIPVSVGSTQYRCEEWNGFVIPNAQWVGFDCETEMIDNNDPTHIPELALLTHHDDAGNSLFIHPDRVADWVLSLQGKQLVGHNVAFDFWVVAEHLAKCEQWHCLAVWWQYTADGMLHDTMILERLIALAHSDEHPGNLQRLDKLAKKYLDVELDKHDSYRLRFGELIGYPTDSWHAFDRGFFEYAIADSIATLKIHECLRRDAIKYRPWLTEILPDAEEKWGPLTETLQVRGAIALAGISRTGIQVDLDQVEPVRVEIHRIINGQASKLEMLGFEYDERNAVFKYNKHGMFIRTDAGVPRKNAKVIKEILNKIAVKENIFPPENKDDLVTDSVKFWEQHADAHPFIETYVTWAAQGKLAQFLVNLKDERIYPRYTPLVRTGRASCSGPNLQQLPRQGDFREMIVSMKDHWLLSIDYGTLELRTLAQTCLTRYGRSSLAEVFQDGGDPHIYTAAMMLGMGTEEFATLPKDQQKQHRQQAKAVNFGVPGGLGAKALAEYAKIGYGVEMNVKEATKLRNDLIHVVYPELKRHLQEQKYHIAAENMCVHVDAVRDCFTSYKLFDYAVQIIGGIDAYGNEADEKWTPTQRNTVWDEVIVLNRNPELVPLLAARKPNPKLARLLLFGNSSTLSGRVRGHIRFAARCNTPFQGLAADGAKLAMFELLRRGHKVVGFVHDEVMIEVPREEDIDMVYAEVNLIMCDAMKDLCPDIPIICEGLVADCWGKVDQEYNQDGSIIPYTHTRKSLPDDYEKPVLDNQLELW